MRFHMVAAVVALTMCALLRVTKVECILVLMVIALVLSAECINTGIERLADRVSLDEDPAIKNCKDAASGGVLVMSTLSVIVGMIIFVPHILEVLW